MIPCPQCGDRTRTLREPRQVRARVIGRALIRWHVCRACSHRFFSFQVAVVTEDDAEVAMSFAEALEKVA